MPTSVAKELCKGRARYASDVVDSETTRASFSAQKTAFEDAGRHFGSPAVIGWLVANTPAESADLVLDVAAGTSIYGRALAGRVAAVIAVDLTPEMLVEGKRAVEDVGLANIVFQRGDATDLPFLNQSFDRVVSRLSIHHFEDALVPLAEMVRVCRIGGTISIVDMVAPNEIVQARFNELEHKRDPAHTRALTREQLHRSIESEHCTITHTASYDNVLVGDDWLAQTATPPAEAALIRRAWDQELAGGEATGMLPRHGEHGIEFVHRWELVVAKVLSDSQPGSD